MLRLISFTILLTALACQSSAYKVKRPDVSRMPRSPGPMVVPATEDAGAAQHEGLPQSSSEASMADEGAIVPSAPEREAIPETARSLPEGADEGGIPSISKAVFLGEADPTKNKNLPYGLLNLSSNAENWIISRPQYVLSWNPKTRNLNWVAWLMNLDQFGSVGRQPNFVVDPDLKDYIAGSGIKAVTTSDYSGSCFDRGHQVASSDRQAKQEDNAATFYTTNIIPQVAFLNQVIWKKLEGNIKEWLTNAKYKNLWVVAGPIYDSKLTFMGPDKNIAVPKANFKAVFAWDDASKNKPFLVKAVIMPNLLSNGKGPLEDDDRRCWEAKNGGRTKGDVTLSEDVDTYLVTIPAIEAAAHLKFPSAVRP